MSVTPQYCQNKFLKRCKVSSVTHVQNSIQVRVKPCAKTQSLQSYQIIVKILITSQSKKIVCKHQSKPFMFRSDGRL